MRISKNHSDFLRRTPVIVPPLLIGLGVMNTQLTEIAFILDRSGSMTSCQDAAIAGFNQFLHEQKDAPGTARLTLVLFDGEYEVPFASVPLEELTDLDAETYVPRGSTALLDAMGRTIDELGARLAALTEDQRPGQVIVCTLTDGFENSSQKFSFHDISAKIGHQRDTYGWTFLFLGANQDAIASAARMNIRAKDSSNYLADSFGTTSGQRAMSRKIRAMRTTAVHETLTPEEQADLNAPLSDLATEEDRKARDE